MAAQVGALVDPYGGTNQAVLSTLDSTGLKVAGGRRKMMKQGAGLANGSSTT
jgi:hypothetical protein